MEVGHLEHGGGKAVRPGEYPPHQHPVTSHKPNAKVEQVEINNCNFSFYFPCRRWFVKRRCR